MLQLLLNLFQPAPVVDIDTLIREKGAMAVVGMEQPDPAIMNRVGQRSWAEKLRGQRRIYKPAAR